MKIVSRSRSSSAMILAWCATASLSRSRIETTATALPLVDHRQMADAVLVHQPQAVREGVREIDGDDVAHHDVGDRRRLGRLSRQHQAPRAIALRQHADQRPRSSTTRKPMSLSAMICSADSTLSAGPTVHSPLGLDSKIRCSER